MPEVNRRDFVKYSATAATAVVAAGTGFPGLAAASGPAPSPAVDDLTQRFDLVIAGGEVLDPSQNLRGVRDIGITNGRIRAIRHSISSDLTAQVLPAAGKLVVPGLVDLHAHVYPQASGLGLPPRRAGPADSDDHVRQCRRRRGQQCLRIQALGGGPGPNPDPGLPPHLHHRPRRLPRRGDAQPGLRGRRPRSEDARREPGAAHRRQGAGVQERRWYQRADPVAAGHPGRGTLWHPCPG